MWWMMCPNSSTWVSSDPLLEWIEVLGVLEVFLQLLKLMQVGIVLGTQMNSLVQRVL